MALDFSPLTLQGEHVRLEPLSASHAADLALAAQDGELWRLWYTAVPTPQGMAAEIDRRLGLLERRSMMPFAVVLAQSGKAVGMTTYMNMDEVNCRVEIGSTWYARSVQRTSLNTEAKRMLLAHAFENWHCIAVEFRTHWHNRQSRKAIERLGAKLDGVLRNHQIQPQGQLRDTCVYSIIASEWPAVRANLDHQLALPR